MSTYEQYQREIVDIESELIRKKNIESLNNRLLHRNSSMKQTQRDIDQKYNQIHSEEVNKVREKYKSIIKQP